MRRQITGLLFLSFACFSVFSIDTNKKTVLYTSKSLSVDYASKIAWAALSACRKKGYSVSVAIVDTGGNLQVFLRDRFAGPHTVKTAFQKAWTANSFRQNTAVLATLLKKGKIPQQVQHNPGALLVGGGVIIRAGGISLGAVGVSGAPPGKSESDSIDGNCAQAGIKAVQSDIDFSI